MTWQGITNMNNKRVLAVAKVFLVALAGFAVQAQATTISTSFEGSDCVGVFGDTFSSCTIFVNDNGEDIALSPVIAKYEDFDDDGLGLIPDDINNIAFPSVDGTEFGFSNLTGGNQTGTWDYTQGADDPGVRYWVAKSADGFKLFFDVDASALDAGGACDVADIYTLACLSAANVVDSGDWTTSGQELSHITFYDTAVVPVPAAVWLFGSGLGLLGWLRRKPV
jgi:hypothetical protein